ncbi:hypothetical protein [Gordonia sp. NB41Y]|uniref:hypothetical protein n=1 Tax=Gordonia sp. NB41Y TaxID=875808 RepID=UPI0002BDA659|nr:hypothetical protein [Gordonia sp. NB41Y]WLP90079.1 hypothetical protein Q9K23_21550 [Gordonia sp. NB41Y]
MTTTPRDMPTKAARPLSQTEERRLRARTANRLVILQRGHLAELTADELLLLHEHIDNFYRELGRRIGQAARD